ncbi:MAG: hypothetical protein ACTSXX_14350 [Candidatus Baldrarchaeia archaeon]
MPSAAHEERDLIEELLEEEWRKRRARVVETRKMEVDDIIIFSIVKLNHRVSTLSEKLDNLSAEVASLKNDVKLLKTVVLGIILPILIAIVSILVTILLKIS